LKNGGAPVLYTFVNRADTLRSLHADPERLLRRFVIRRAGEMGRVAVLLGGLLAGLPRRAVDAAKARLEEARREAVLAAAARALAWATALRRKLLLINRCQKAAVLWPDFAPAPAGSLAPARGGAVERDRPPRGQAGGFEPMEMAAMQAALKAPFLAPEMLEAVLNSVQARLVALTHEIDRQRANADAAGGAGGGAGEGAAEGAANRRPTPEDDAATLGVEEHSFGEVAERICDDLLVAALELGDTELAERVRLVADDLRRRCQAMTVALAAKAAAAAKAEARVALSVASVVAVAMRPLIAALWLAGFQRAVSPRAVPPRHGPRHERRRVGSLRAGLLGSVSLGQAAFDTG
jgi:hypothetical protein